MSGQLDGRGGIDAALVRRLLAAQFPQWADLPVRPVEVDGWDNRTYRLGETMSVRLPSAPGYADAVAKEDEWLPRLAARLPVAVPEVLGHGVPGEGYPHPWSVRRWLAGETASPERIGDLVGFATAVGGFVRALQQCDATGGPLPGPHNFHRGGPPAYYDDDTRRALDALRGRVDTTAAAVVWERALTTRWTGSPVWFHGDLATGNLLVDGGRLTAVIDFGTSGIGDPACDLVIAWTLFSGAGRRAFRQAVDHDPATWDRARGWALWKALIVLAEAIDNDERVAAVQRTVIERVLADDAVTHHSPTSAEPPA